MNIEQIKTPGLTDYSTAVDFMEKRAGEIAAGTALPCLWFLEHPALYTGGTSARDEDLLAQDLPVYKTGRGGKYTYHGPGQRVVYVMMDLKTLHDGEPDLRRYIRQLEDWIIQSLGEFGIQGERRDARVGIWVKDKSAKGGEAKIAAIGVRVRKWVTMHGISINLDPDLKAFNGIVPCGISQYGVTSLTQYLDRDVKMAEIDAALDATRDKTLLAHKAFS